MDKKEAKTRFEKADRLFSHGRFEDALQELDALEVHYPDNHRILNAQARTLERLRRYDRALEVCDRLLNEFQYEKIRLLREDIARSLSNLSSKPPSYKTGLPTAPSHQRKKEKAVNKKESRFKIKPIRLLLLLAICGAMYLGYVPIWLGAGIIVAYFALKFLIGAAFLKLFSAPFKMKGKALAGATCTMHGFEWTEKPVHEHDDEGDSDEDYGEDFEDDDDEPEVPLRYVWLDVTITPQERSEGFTHWEPGELMLAPADLKFNGLDNLESCYGAEDVRLANEQGDMDDEDGKYAGPQRIKLLFGIPKDKSNFTLAYYFEQFGSIQLSN
jgi:tetratricopeptide (TPR) repeat protein